MSYSYAQKKKGVNAKKGGKPTESGKESSVPNSARLADIEKSNHQVDMPTVMREKMEGAFGMDLSAVKLYENRAVGEAGAEAVAKGSKIAFAPGKLDFSSSKGQELLGHEISHVASQARGEVRGSGFLKDSALEARADREGSMAARGESVVSAPLSNASAASAAGPMQAKSGKKNSNKAPDPEMVDGEELGESKNGLVKERKQRGLGGTILDWFSTTGSHWFAPSKELKKLRAAREKEEMDKIAVFNDEDLVPDEIEEEEEETMKKMPLLPKMDEEE